MEESFIIMGTDTKLDADGKIVEQGTPE